jgi:hypothetical protein
LKKVRDMKRNQVAPLLMKQEVKLKFSSGLEAVAPETSIFLKTFKQGDGEMMAPSTRVELISILRRVAGGREGETK